MIKKSFTLLEIIFVIVILSIVIGVTTEYMLNLFQANQRTKILNRLQNETGVILNQISKRLSHRIVDSTIVNKYQQPNLYLMLESNLVDNSQNYTTLQWIGIDYDGFLGIWDGVKIAPTWNGFIDLGSLETNTSQVHTRGSRLSDTNLIIKMVSSNKVDLSGNNGKVVLIFKGQKGNIAKYWDCQTQSECFTKIVKNRGDDILEFFDDENKTIYEQYYLSWSAYAIEKDDKDNLNLYYNYRPWENQNYKDDGKKVLLGRNIQSFRFRQIGSAIRVKICIDDNNKTDGFNEIISFCKEKTIF